MMFLAIISLTVGSVLADSVNVKCGGKVVGTLEYSYSFQTSDRGCFIKVHIVNHSDEFVHGRATCQGTEKMCGAPFDIHPYGKTDVTIGCGETPSDVILEFVQCR